MMDEEELKRIEFSWNDIRPLHHKALMTAFQNGKKDVPELISEVRRLRRIISVLGFCPTDGESMPCLTCGAGL